MDKDIYDIINDYCTSKDQKELLVPAEKGYVLRRFLDCYYEALDKYREDNGRDADETAKKTILSSFLNDSVLQSYVDSAKRYYEKFVANIEVTYKKAFEKPFFWKNIGISILANLFYSLFLILVFLVAKDQLAVWLMQLLSK